MRSFLMSFVYAFRGIGYQLACERNFRIHCFAALTVLGLSFFYEFTPAEWGLLILQITLVMGSESLNTAIEQTDNKITREKSRHIRNAKDTAAAAVLIFAAGAVAIAYVLFWDLQVIGEIIAFFCHPLRLALLIVYVALIVFFVFCKKTYKKG